MPEFAPSGGGPFGGAGFPPPPPVPPPPVVITTDLSTIFADVPAVTIAFADSINGTYTDCDHCYLNQLNIVAAPRVDECRLTWYYGKLMQPGETTFGDVSPLAKLGKFVRVTIENNWDDTGTDLVWHGVVENDTKKPYSSQSEDIATGVQSLLCYGLLRLCERKQIASTFVENSAGDGMIEIHRGLVINEDERGEIKSHGNRSESKYTIAGQAGTPVESYIFSYKERGQDSWSAEEAVEYLLCAHARDLTPGVKWRLYVSSGNLQWNPKGGTRTDRRTLKALFDELISRQRGVGYEVHYSAGAEEVIVRVFSFSDIDINMPNGETFVANPEQYSLDFEAALDVSMSELNDTILSKYHRVIVEGDWITTTATLRIEEELKPDWTSTDETAYHEAASTLPNYPSERVKRVAINRATRNEDRLRNVYSRFRVDDDWNLTVDSLDGLFDDNRVFPKLDVYNGYGLVSTTEDWPTWIAGLTIADKLPLRERYDYKDANIEDNTWEDSSDVTELTAFMEPFALTKTQIANTDTWELLSTFDSRVKDKPDRRKWHVTTRPHQDRPAVSLNVISGPQQFIAKTEFEASANTDLDPDDWPTKNHGINYTDIAITLTIETTEKARIERVIELPGDGQLERVLRIHVEDCRLDYVVPNTVVGLKGGELQFSDGGFVRDDRIRLDTICKAAATWYGIERQTLELSYKQVRPIVSLGWLITDIGGNYQKTNVNSIVTEIRYDMVNPSTSFQTSYAEMDLA